MFLFIDLIFQVILFCRFPLLFILQRNKKETSFESFFLNNRGLLTFLRVVPTNSRGYNQTLLQCSYNLFD